ncbi:MAG TPA: adenine methyltransferase, partial [Balneola sp.]|nr:adenine methyltransferase [Balneola sp.]
WKGHTVFVNPPYGRGIGEWLKKGYEEAQDPDTTVVMLIPARTDT